MTELQFEKRILNEKGDLIFQFNAITNRIDVVNKKCYQRFDGDVIVNLSKEEAFISGRAWRSLKNDQWDNHEAELLEETKKMNSDEEIRQFIEKKCEEAVYEELFKYCEKLKDVIL